MDKLALICFYFFSGVTLLGALGVVLIKNPMRAAVSLLFSFVGVAALFLLRHAEFLAAVQLLVYAGGILVLFLFAIMFVSQKDLPKTKKWHGQWPFAIILGMLLAVSVIYLVSFKMLIPSGTLENFRANGGNTEAIGLFLYRHYLVPFEVASVFLLVAMVGAIFLGRGGANK